MNASDELKKWGDSYYKLQTAMTELAKVTRDYKAKFGNGFVKEKKNGR